MTFAPSRRLLLQSAAGVLAVFLAFLGVAEFNTALSSLVPAINVAFIAVVAVLGYNRMLPL